jgi:hypothetical protein
MGEAKLWAIVGMHGLYVGTWYRRIDAIAAHAHDMRLHVEPETPRYPALGFRKLSPEQKTIWRRCKHDGDRAVKVTVTWGEDRPE